MGSIAVTSASLAEDALMDPSTFAALAAAVMFSATSPVMACETCTARGTTYQLLKTRSGHELGVYRGTIRADVAHLGRRDAGNIVLTQG